MVIFRGDLPWWSSVVIYFNLLRFPITSNYNICIKKTILIRSHFPHHLPQWSSVVTFHSDLLRWPSPVIFRCDLLRWPSAVIFCGDLPQWSSVVIYFNLLRFPITSNYNICIKNLFWLDLIFPTNFRSDLPRHLLRYLPWWPSAVPSMMTFRGDLPR